MDSARIATSDGSKIVLLIAPDASFAVGLAEGATVTPAGRAHEFVAGSKVSSAGTVAVRSGVTQLDGDALMSHYRRPLCLDQPFI
jgi:hypothetical protein